VSKYKVGDKLDVVEAYGDTTEPVVTIIAISVDNTVYDYGANNKWDYIADVDVNPGIRLHKENEDG